jgi:hypothetical protein
MKKNLVLFLLCCWVGLNAGEMAPRVITLDDTFSCSEETYGKFICWECCDYIENDGKTIVEVGTFTNPIAKSLRMGFILYDGTNGGNITHFQRKGIDLRWDWIGNGSDYSFIIKPDGVGLYYNFNGAKSKPKADQVFRCRKKGGGE